MTKKVKPKSGDDIAMNAMRRLFHACESHFLRAEKLEKALRESIEDVYWMSGSSDFSAPSGIASKGWATVRARAARHSATLTLTPKRKGK